MQMGMHVAYNDPECKMRDFLFECIVEDHGLRTHDESIPNYLQPKSIPQLEQIVSKNLGYLTIFSDDVPD